MTHHTISLRVPEEMVVRYDELARARGTDREHLMMDALGEYLGAARDDARRTREAMAEVDRGEYVSAEKIEAEELAWLASQGYTRERIAAIDQQVCDELRTAYGVAPCE
jgi:predicted transcriptional regulator